MIYLTISKVYIPVAFRGRPVGFKLTFLYFHALTVNLKGRITFNRYKTHIIAKIMTTSSQQQALAILREIVVAMHVIFSTKRLRIEAVITSCLHLLHLVK